VKKVTAMRMNEYYYYMERNPSNMSLMGSSHHLHSPAIQYWIPLDFHSHGSRSS